MLEIALFLIGVIVGVAWAACRLRSGGETVTEAMRRVVPFGPGPFRPK